MTSTIHIVDASQRHRWRRRCISLCHTHSLNEMVCLTTRLAYILMNGWMWMAPLYLLCCMWIEISLLFINEIFLLAAFRFILSLLLLLLLLFLGFFVCLRLQDDKNCQIKCSIEINDSQVSSTHSTNTNDEQNVHKCRVVVSQFALIFHVKLSRKHALLFGCISPSLYHSRVGFNFVSQSHKY